jgi:hypothetical protein
VQARVHHFLPALVFARLHVNPDHGAMEIAGKLRDGRRNGVGAVGQAIDLHQAHGGAVDLGGGSVLNQALALEHAEAAVKEVQAGARPDQGVDGGVVAHRSRGQQRRNGN